MDVNIKRLLRGSLARLVLAGALASGIGCLEQFRLVRPDPIAKQTDTLVLGAEGLVEEKQKAKLPEDVAATLADAREYFRRQEYAKAEDLFYRIAENDKNPAQAVQEAIYYRAECLRLQGYYPRAADMYVSLLNKFPHNPYREQCLKNMFDIANFWLQDTREEMQEAKERKEGKRWFVMPRFFSIDKQKPFVDREGRAIEKLEQVRIHDISGPLADQALFMCGAVKLYNENYRDADYYFSQISQRHKDSKLAAKSTELAIFCKHMSTGGSDYDGRKAAEARELVQVALRSHPQLANNKEKREYLDRQLKGIDLQQAEKDFKMGEFYRRTGHPGSAYFYYWLVIRRYPTTDYAKQASQRVNEIRTEVAAEQGKMPPGPEQVASGAKPRPVTPAVPSGIPQIIDPPDAKPQPTERPAPARPEQLPPPRDGGSPVPPSSLNR